MNTPRIQDANRGSQPPGTGPDLQRLLAVTLDQVSKLLAVEGASLALVDPESGEIRFEVMFGGDEEALGRIRLKSGQGVVGQVIEEGRPVTVHNARSDPRWYGGVDEESGFQTESILCVPLRVKGKVLGAIEALNKQAGEFTTRDEQFLSSLADLAAQAIQNVRELAFLHRAGQLLNTSLQPQEVLAETLTQVEGVLGVEGASLWLVDHKTDQIKLEFSLEEIKKGNAGSSKERWLARGQGIVGQVIEQQRPRIVNDVSRYKDWHGELGRQGDFRTESILCVPLCVQGKAIGAIQALNKLAGQFTIEDQQLLWSMADLAARAIENARLYQQLQEAFDNLQKLDELRSTFIDIISHELRTPLSLIKGSLEFVLSEELGSLQPEQRAQLSVVAEQSAHLTRIVNDAITLETIIAEQKDFEGEVPLLPLVQKALAGAHPKAEAAGITLELVPPPAQDRCSVWGNVDWLSRVLEHLLDNAIKFSPPGGTVCLRLKQERDSVLVEVEDEGEGIPADQLERVFEPFYQIDSSLTRRHGGLGLGLALFKKVVMAHGGQVWVTSKAGQGSTFAFSLPLYPVHNA